MKQSTYFSPQKERIRSSTERLHNLPVVALLYGILTNKPEFFHSINASLMPLREADRARGTQKLRRPQVDSRAVKIFSNMVCS